MNILLLEDTLSFRAAIKSMLQKKSNVFAAESPSTAFRIFKSQKIDILICDYLLPEMDGIEVLEKVKNEYPDVEVIMISSSGNMDTVIDALRKGATDFLKKPFRTEDIWVSIERTKKYSQLQSELKKEKTRNKLLKNEINKEFGLSFIGNSQRILEIKDQMKMVAQTPDTSVLLLGESGTGKELIARGIHNLSKRKDELFGAVNMAAVPENLFESEFFGHKKGSFTGAISEKSGWFESAHKGTLFLDEIGELPLNLQVKLLRVLEDRKFVKVGDQKEKSFDIRIISATNKSIEDLNAGNEFRIDLFHRLGTFIIQVPPLRERKEDLIELTSSFLKTINQKIGKEINSINPEVFQLLKNYNFPGNIRELKNLVERAVIICQEKELQPSHFKFLSLTSRKIEPDLIPSAIFDLDELEKQTIIKALSEANNNKSEAARLLNLDWNALYRRLKKHNIQ